MYILNTIMSCLSGLILIVFLLNITSKSVHGQDLSIESETGGIWFSRNDVRIPNDGGTDFDFIELIGSDAAPFYRIRLNITFGDRHTLRLLFAPLRKIGSGSYGEPVFFEETLFEENVPIDGTYKFNTYRLTYRYTFYNQNNWLLGGGITALVRDAEVRLEQPNRADSNTDIGFVPLLHLYAQRDFGSAMSLIFDVETLAGPQGRATDAALTFNYNLTENWRLHTGYRVLEGGADVDEVFNFAWINYLLLGVKVSL